MALYFMLAGYYVRIGFDGERFDLSLRHDTQAPRRVEVKWDKRSQKSGNLYFEVENTRQKKPSGVFSSTADWWCHVLGEGNTGLMIRVDLLRTYLQKGSFRQVNTGGADSNSRGLLVPLAEARREAHFHEVELPTVNGYFAALLEASFPRRGGSSGQR